VHSLWHTKLIPLTVEVLEAIGRDLSNHSQTPLLPDDLDQHPFPPPAVELTAKDPLPRARIKPAVGHRDHHLAAHHLRSAAGFCCPLQVRVRIVLTGAVVPILVDRRVRCQFFEPHLVIMMQAAFVVVCQKNTIVG
jgi:hypothetical protein